MSPWEKDWIEKKKIIDNTFVYIITLNVMNDNKDHKFTSVDECQHGCDWPKWKDTIQTKLNSLEKCEVFGLVVQTLKGVLPTGYKRVFA